MFYTRLVLMGITNIGKTRMALTMPDVLVIECDPGGSESIPEIPSERIFESWAEPDQFSYIEDILGRLLDKKDELSCKTIMWDGIGEFSRNALDYIMETVTIHQRNSSIAAGRIMPEQDDYQGLANRFRRILRKMNQVEAHKVFITHTKVNRDEKNKSRQLEADIMGQMRASLIKSQASFGAVMKKVESSGKFVWNYSMGHELLTKTRSPLELDKQQQKTTAPNFAKFLHAALKGKGWTEEQIRKELSEQYGSEEEMLRVAKLKYEEMIR